MSLSLTAAAEIIEAADLTAASKARMLEVAEAADKYGYTIRHVENHAGLVLVVEQKRPGRLRDTFLRVEAHRSPRTGRDRFEAKADHWMGHMRPPVTELPRWLSQHRAL